MLGSSNGGLDWETQVKPMMESYLKDLPIEVRIHEYDPESSAKSEVDKNPVNMAEKLQPKLI